MASEKALQRAAQAWCTETTKKKTMDPVLAEAIANILDEEWEKERRVFLAQNGVIEN